MAHSPETTAAWNAVIKHVDIARVDQAFDAALWKLCVAFARTLPPPPAKGGAVTGTNGKKLRSGMVIRFGNSKGKAIEELETKDLLWYIARAEESIDDPGKAQYKQKNAAELDLLQAELKTR